MILASSYLPQKLCVNQNIGQLLTRRAYRDPELEAVYDAGNGKRFSYSQLNANSNRTANAFTDLGLGKGDAVGLLLLNSVEYLESFFAAAKTGLVVVPLNWRLVADELQFILNDAEVGLLVFPSPAGCRMQCQDGPEDEPLERLIARPEIGARLAEGLGEHNRANPGGSTRITRVLMMTEPAAIDAGEITDKGYINQRAVLTRRADLVARLYAEPISDDILIIG